MVVETQRFNGGNTSAVSLISAIDIQRLQKTQSQVTQLPINLIAPLHPSSIPTSSLTAQSRTKSQHYYDFRFRGASTG